MSAQPVVMQTIGRSGEVRLAGLLLCSRVVRSRNKRLMRGAQPTNAQAPILQLRGERPDLLAVLALVASLHASTSMATVTLRPPGRPHAVVPDHYRLPAARPEPAGVPDGRFAQRSASLPGQPRLFCTTRSALYERQSASYCA